MIRFMLVMAPVVLLINATPKATGRRHVTLSVAVGLTPMLG
ncbi:hypothetical protein ACLB1M_02480 [Escherichia coli]